MVVQIPVLEYKRPHAETREQAWGITGTYEGELQEKLNLFEELGIVITVELIPGIGVSVCLDNGEADYQTWIFQNNEDLPFHVMKKILEFDLNIYTTWKAVQEY